MARIIVRFAMDRKKKQFPLRSLLWPVITLPVLIPTSILIMIPGQELYALAVRCFGQDSLYSQVVLAIHALVGSHFGGAA